MSCPGQVAADEVLFKVSLRGSANPSPSGDGSIVGT